MLGLLSAHQTDLVAVGGAVVTIASALSNIFPKATLLGRVSHFLALNWKLK